MDREGEPGPDGGVDRVAAGSDPEATPESPAGLPPGAVDAEAIAEEARAVEAAAAEPAVGAPGARRRETDRTFFLGAIALALLLAFGWLGGTAVWQLRRDLRALDARVAGTQDRAARLESLQARASLLRVRADLDALRQTLPPDLAAEVGRADAILGEVAGRVAPNP